MKNNFFYIDDFIDFHLFHAVYWRNFYFFYFFYNSFYFFTMRLIFANFFKYFWVVKLYRILFNFELLNFPTFQLETDNLIDDYNPDLDFSIFFCIELVHDNYPAFFKRLNTSYTNIDFKKFSLLFEIPLYVDFYKYEDEEKDAIKEFFNRKAMKIRRLHYYEKLTRNLKRGLLK